jgi:hypothetical protein
MGRARAAATAARGDVDRSRVGGKVSLSGGGLRAHMIAEGLIREGDEWALCCTLPSCSCSCMHTRCTALRWLPLQLSLVHLTVTTLRLLARSLFVESVGQVFLAARSEQPLLVLPCKRASCPDKEDQPW